MSRSKDRGGVPAYLAPLLALIRSSGAMRPGTVTHLKVEHDDWCGYFAAGVCDCNPNVKRLASPPPGWDTR